MTSFENPATEIDPTRVIPVYPAHSYVGENEVLLSESDQRYLERLRDALTADADNVSERE